MSLTYAFLNNGGLEHAIAQGWLVFDSDQRIYTLTHTGFAIA